MLLLFSVILLQTFIKKTLQDVYIGKASELILKEININFTQYYFFNASIPISTARLTIGDQNDFFNTSTDFKKLIGSQPMQPSNIILKNGSEPNNQKFIYNFEKNATFQFNFNETESDLILWFDYELIFNSVFRDQLYLIIKMKYQDFKNRAQNNLNYIAGQITPNNPSNFKNQYIVNLSPINYTIFFVPNQKLTQFFIKKIEVDFNSTVEMQQSLLTINRPINETMELFVSCQGHHEKKTFNESQLSIGNVTNSKIWTFNSFESKSIFTFAMENRYLFQFNYTAFFNSSNADEPLQYQVIKMISIILTNFSNCKNVIGGTPQPPLNTFYFDYYQNQSITIDYIIHIIRIVKLTNLCIQIKQLLCVLLLQYYSQYQFQYLIAYITITKKNGKTNCLDNQKMIIQWTKEEEIILEKFGKKGIKKRNKKNQTFLTINKGIKILMKFGNT